VLTISDLFNDIFEKSKKKDYPYIELFRQFSKKMINKYPFDRKERWSKDENMLQKWAKVNQSMYEWALENIEL
jgi:hypothetical protein